MIHLHEYFNTMVYSNGIGTYTVLKSDVKFQNADIIS